MTTIQILNNPNDLLSLVGSLSDKMKSQAHDLQHLKVSNFDQQRLAHFTKQLGDLAYNLHLLHEDWKQKYQPEMVEPDEKILKSNEVLTKMRHFDGHG